MGNYASKLLSYSNDNRKDYHEHEACAQQAIKENNVTCTPVLYEKRVLDDPRSVSTGIRRTPIEVKCIQGGVITDTPTAIPKYLQKKQYLETDIDVIMVPQMPRKYTVPKAVDNDQQSESNEDYLMINAGVAKDSKVITPIDKERFIILGLDPRSPAADFDRTPILMPKSLVSIKARSQENLSRRSSYETDIYNRKNSRQDDTSLSTPEIRLLSDKGSESLKGSLDMEKQNESFCTSLYDSDLNISKNKEEITKNSKLTNWKKKLLTSDERTVAIDSDEIEKDETEKQDDCENSIEFSTRMKDNDKIKLWHDSLSSEESISGKKGQKELSLKKASKESVIIMFDKCTTSTSLKPVKTERDFRKEDVKRKKKNAKIKVDVKFEKKVFTPENKRGTEMYENRIPLGNRSNNGQVRKKSQELLRDKASRLQQENTPPPCKTYNEKIINEIQWDPNSTILI